LWYCKIVKWRKELYTDLEPKPKSKTRTEDGRRLSTGNGDVLLRLMFTSCDGLLDEETWWRANYGLP
jgi:hypothetical protein